jgi:hypothetical protein
MLPGLFRSPQPLPQVSQDPKDILTQTSSDDISSDGDDIATDEYDTQEGNVKTELFPTAFPKSDSNDSHNTLALVNAATGKRFELASDTFDYYKGAPCPICYCDLGKVVPKTMDFKERWRSTIKMEKGATDALREHIYYYHQHCPVWNVYRILDLLPKDEAAPKAKAPKKPRKCNKLATAESLTHYCLSAAAQKISFPFEPLTEEGIYSHIDSRFEVAKSVTSMGTGNYFRKRVAVVPEGVENPPMKKTDCNKWVRESCIKQICELQGNFRRSYAVADIPTILNTYSVDQLASFINCYFLWKKHYLKSPNWLYTPDGDNVVQKESDDAADMSE